MAEKFRSIGRIAANLIFSLKEVFLSNPFIFAGSLSAQLVNTFSYFLILYFGKKIIDVISSALISNAPITSTLTDVAMWLILSAVFSLVLVVINYIKTVLEQKQHRSFDKYINLKMARKCAELDISYFDSPQYYDKIAKAQNGKTRLGFLVYRVIFFIANIFTFVIALTVSIMHSNILPVLLILSLIIPSLFTKGHYYRTQFEYENASQKIKRKISYLAGLIFGKDAAKEIRFYKMEQFVADKYRHSWNEYGEGMRRIILTRGLVDSVLSVLPVAGMIVSMYYVVISIINGKSPVGDFAFLLGIYTSLTDSFLSLTEDMAKLSESEYAIQKYKDFMSAKPAILYNGHIKLDKIEQIRFEGVSFTYPQSRSKALCNISFSLYPDKRNAIVGVNGSGKTTIVKLLLRFYDVDEGAILINGISIKEYDIDSLRSRFSAVFQDYVIYSLSIRDNVAFSNFGNKNNDASVIQALEFAELMEDMRHKKTSLDTFLSRDFTEDGIELSGGQKQKMAIARCAFSKSQILILDEPTASLDPEAENAVISKLNKLYKNKGLILISHRLSNLTSMDNIIVIKNGGMLESGSHEQLMKLKNEYYTLFTLQADKYKDVSIHAQDS